MREQFSQGRTQQHSGCYSNPWPFDHQCDALTTTLAKLYTARLVDWKCRIGQWNGTQQRQTDHD